MKRITKTFLPIGWMGLIFYLSNKPASFYADIPIQPDYAHIFIYGVLSALIIYALAGWGIEWRARNVFIFILALSLFYGATDEFHQRFVHGRTPSMSDWLLDGIGSILGVILSGFISKPKKPKLLLHICCIGCGVFVSQDLKKEFDVSLYFYNPNIFPEKEHEIRLNEIKKIAKKFGIRFIIEKYDHKKWLDLVRGHELEPEKGSRCLICYRERLQKTVEMAKKNKFDYFASTLSTSPHKDAEAINKIGSELATQYKINFLAEDFKKDDGFKKSCQLSKDLQLYRQNYCGCEFSRRK